MFKKHGRCRSSRLPRDKSTDGETTRGLEEVLWPLYFPQFSRGVVTHVPFCRKRHANRRLKLRPASEAKKYARFTAGGA
jgi:hypothetical protein